MAKTRPVLPSQGPVEEKAVSTKASKTESETKSVLKQGPVINGLRPKSVKPELSDSVSAHDRQATARSTRQHEVAIKESSAKQGKSELRGTVLVSDIQSNQLESSFERAAKLTGNVKRLEASVQAKTRELTTLQSVVARLKDEKLDLERRLDNLVHENAALRSGDSGKERKINSLLLAINRQQHEMLWGICHFIAGSEEFEPFAEGVGFDLTRLFCMLLEAEIREAADLSPQIKAHASAIAYIFDPFFYLTEYEEVAREGINPLVHYIKTGWRENRNPTRLFDCNYYRNAARLQDGEPLLHYIEQGERIGLKPHPLFDGSYYYARYADVAEQKINSLFHYQTWGWRERREPSLVFDTEYFLESRGLPVRVDNPLVEYLRDAADVLVDPHPLFLTSYFSDQTGISNAADKLLFLYEKETVLNRSVRPHPMFDLDFIRNQIGGEFPEDASPLETFCKISQYRDIDPSLLFDSSLYRYQVEVEKGRQLKEPPIIDYLKRGYKDKTLLPNIVFDPQTYRTHNNFDFSGPELTHYCLFGDQLGFVTHPLFNAEVYNSNRSDDVSRSTAIEHFLGSPPDRRHVSNSHAGRPLLHETLDFVRSVYAEDVECNPSFYKENYADLSGLTEAEAKAHFETDGKNEGRLGSARAVVKHFNLRIRDLPLGFFPDEYVQLNPDLLAVGMKPDFLPTFGHYMEFGRAENRTIGKWQFYLDSIDLRVPNSASPMSLNTDAAQIDVCVLIHLFYPDLWPELAAFARNFESVSRDVFVNVVDIAWTPGLQREMRELCPDAFVQLSNDNGRDIGGFIRLLDNVDIKKYDLFAFMHSKKSPHIAPEKGDYWRRCLLRAFAGSQDVVSECVQMFRDDPTLGLIGAKEWRATEMGNNEAQVNRMLDLFEIEPQFRSVEYLSGTMFLIRSDAVQKIYDVLKGVEWEYGGDKDVSFHMDGQAAHAVERVVGNLIRQMGYRMAWR